MDFTGFMSALTESWVALMSGIASVVLAFIGVLYGYVWKKDLPARALWLAALACFLIAAVKIWTIEHKARLGSESQLALLTQPILGGRFNFYGIAPAKNGCLVTVNVLVTNKGAASIITNPTLVIYDGKGQKFKGTVLPPTEGPVTLIPEKGATGVRFQSSEYLFVRAAEKPIPTNGAASGYLIALIPGLAGVQELAPSGYIQFGFEDINGKKYSIDSGPFSGRDDWVLPDVFHLQHSRN